MYANGEGVPQDDAEAVRWYCLAAEQGDAKTQYNLGVMYGNGKGVPQDDVAAYAWLNIGAGEGNNDAAQSRDIVAERLTPQQRAEAQRLSQELWKKYVNK